MIRISQATNLDAGPMAELLTGIITAGGTTAMTRPVTRAEVLDRMDFDPARAAWHVARDADGTVCGFQYIEPHDALPPVACDIATFVRLGRTGLGIGSALFDATARAARALGYAWISANIRADNTGGLIYYQSRGFRDYDRIEDHRHASGQIVDKVLKRYDLD